jgi:hypothetical protein
MVFSVYQQGAGGYAKYGSLSSCSCECWEVLDVEVFLVYV